MSLQSVNLAVALDVAEEFKGEKDAANGCAGEARGLGDFGDAAPVVMALKAFDDAKPASQGENKVGISRLGGKLVSRGFGYIGMCGSGRDHRVGLS